MPHGKPTKVVSGGFFTWVEVTTSRWLSCVFLQRSHLEKYLGIRLSHQDSYEIHSEPDAIWQMRRGHREDAKWMVNLKISSVPCQEGHQHSYRKTPHYSLT